jgi:hypothetical protein
MTHKADLSVGGLKELRETLTERIEQIERCVGWLLPGYPAAWLLLDKAYEQLDELGRLEREAYEERASLQPHVDQAAP